MFKHTQTIGCKSQGIEVGAEKKVSKIFYQNCSEISTMAFFKSW